MTTRNAHSLLMAAACALGVAAPAAAQENRAWPERAFITIDLPVQTLSDQFSEALTFSDTIRKTESAHFSSAYGSTRGPLFDIGAGAHVWRRLGLGGTVSILNRTSAGSFDLTVPSLIAGNRPLDVTGSAPDLARREVALHLQALYPIALGRRSRVTLSVGPSVFNTRQDLVRSVEFETLPGLTTTKLDQAFVTSASKTVVGFNVGADVGWNFARHFGVGTVTRYSRANVTLDPGSVSGVSRAVTTKAGGLHLGGGIRVLF